MSRVAIKLVARLYCLGKENAMLRRTKLFGVLIFSMAIVSCGFAPVNKPEISKVEANISKMKMYNPQNKIRHRE